jgi:hypothetical protein
MGNAFMPSVASSLNQASGQGLLEILQQRILQQEMEKQMLSTQRQGMNDSFSMAMRLKDQQQQDEARKATAARQKTTDDLAASKEATRVRDANNVKGAAGMFFDRLAMDPTDNSPGMQRAAHEGNVRVSMMPKDAKVEPTLAEKEKEAFTLSAARARGTQSVKPSGGGGAKDNPKLPAGVKDALRARKGTPGYKTAAEAIQTVKSGWDQWTDGHPNMDLNAVEAAIRNLYGQEPTAKMTRVAADTPPSSGFDSAALRARLLAKMASRK